MIPSQHTLSPMQQQSHPPYPLPLTHTAAFSNPSHPSHPGTSIQHLHAAITSQLQALTHSTSESFTHLIHSENERLDTLEKYAALHEEYEKLQAVVENMQHSLHESEIREEHTQSQRAHTFSTLQLLLASHQPLLNRYNDMRVQKTIQQSEALRHQQVVQEVVNMKNALRGLDERLMMNAVTQTAENKSSSSAAATSPTLQFEQTLIALSSTSSSRHHHYHQHPYRLHASSHITFRSCVIGILAAKRLWKLSDRRYGVNVEVIDEEERERSVIVGTQDSSSSSNTLTVKVNSSSTSDLPPLDLTTTNTKGRSIIKIFDHFGVRTADGANLSLLSSSSLLKRLIKGHNSFALRKASLAASSSSSSSSTSQTSLTDLASIRGIITSLLQHTHSLQQQHQSLKSDYIQVIERNNFLNESFQTEHIKTQELLKKQEENSQRLIDELQRKLNEQQQERQEKYIEKGDYEQLYHTSQECLEKCKQYETASLRYQQNEVKYREELLEKDRLIETLRGVIEENKRTVGTAERMRVDIDTLQAEVEERRRREEAMQEELTHTRNELAHLHSSHTQLQDTHTNLIASCDVSTRELVRLQDVIRTISQAHKYAEEHVESREKQQQHAPIRPPPLQSPPPLRAIPPPPTNSGSSTASSSATSLRYPSFPTSPLRTITPLTYQPTSTFHPTYLLSPTRSASGSSTATRLSNSLTSSTSSVVSPTTAAPPVVHMRHHQNGQLSIDFGGATNGTISTGSNDVPLATSSSSSTAASSFTPAATSSLHPLAHQYTPRVRSNASQSAASSSYVPSSTSSAVTYSEYLTTTNRFTTPISATSSSHPPLRVKFASDTKP